MNKNKVKKIIKIVSIFLIIIGVIIGGLYASKIVLDNKYPPGTSISGISISFKTNEQAMAILNEAKINYLSTPIVVKLDNALIKITPKDLGVDVLMEETLKEVEKVNSKETNIFEWIGILLGGRENVDVTIKVDETSLINTIKEKFELKGKEPIQASFFFDENKTLQIQEGKSGLLLDTEKLIKDVSVSAKALNQNEIELTLENKEPVVTKEILQSQQEEILKDLNFEIVLMDPVYSDDWYVKLIDHLDWVLFNQKADKVIIEINQEALNKYIDEEISEWLDKPAQQVNIYRDDNGKVVIEGEGSDGMKIQREELKKAIENAVSTKVKEVKIPIETIQPVINASKEFQDLGIKERLGVGHTSYYNSPTNRIHNIKTGALKFNGTLVAPGETFSFVKTLGAVDASTGYRTELVIKAEGTVPEYGGGLCQVSTTMFRAILFSGLPVVERYPHSYAVSYYSQVLGHGLDATIYIGGPDLKFLNDTEKDILIQSYVKDDYELYFVFYGTSDGRSVKMDGPYLSNYHSPGPTIYKESASLKPGATKQVEKAHTGFNAVWYRYLTDKNGVETKETITTAYKAVPAKILVGAPDAPATPAEE